jgi:hypothetical protein
VSTDARGDVWVAGWERDAEGTRPLVAHFDGTRWSDLPTPPFDRDVVDVAAWGGAIWALEEDAGVLGTGSVARWSGGWRIISIPKTVVGAISVVAGKLWAAGDRGRDAVLMKLNRSGVTTVSRVRLPGEALAVADLDGSNGNDIWVVGNRSDIRNGWRFVLHWNGVRLERVRLSRLGLNADERFQSALVAVTAPTRSRAWAFGYNLGVDNLLVERWDGQRWRVVPRRMVASLPRNAGITAVARNGSGDLWAVGGLRTGILELPAGGLALRWSEGHWRRVPVPFFEGNLSDVAITRRSVWVVGGDNVSPLLGKPGSAVVLRRSCP